VERGLQSNSPLPHTKNNMLNLIAMNKRGEGRAEIIEKRRREFLIRNNHNKMYLYHHAS
jgi:hypothetical protein